MIAGKAKGRLLVAPKGLSTRPITAVIKEALFNILQTQIVGSRFLDLFAGSGSIGIEAISRGAENVVFVEKEQNAINTIKKNLAACKFQNGYEIYRDDVFRRIKRLDDNGYMFDIIYLDPPFTEDKIFLPVMETLSNTNLIAKGGIIVIRTRKEKRMPDTINALYKCKFKNYGLSNLYFYSHHLDVM